MTSAAVVETNEVRTDNLRAATVKTGNTLIQEASRLLNSLEEGADPSTLKRVNAQFAAALAGVRSEASSPQTITTEPTALEYRRQEFLTKYSIQVLGESQVSFTLPSGTSRIDLLNEAQALAPELHGRPAVYAPRLEKWAADPAFTTAVTKDEVIGVNGNVSNSTRMRRDEQEARGWNNVDLADLATAHQAYFIATGKNLFDGNVVRARGGALYFYGSGLCVSVYDDADRHNKNVAASAAMAPRN